MARYSKTSYAVDEMSVTNAPADYGNGEDNHMPIGWYGSTGWRYRGLLKFYVGKNYLPDGARIVSALLKVKTTGSTKHVAKGSNVRLRIGRLVSAFDSSIGDGEVWQSSGGTTGFPSMSDVITFPAEGQHRNGTVYTYDITNIVERIARSSVFKRDGTPCDALPNHGVGVRSDDESSSTRTTEFWSSKGGYDLRVVLTYDLEDAPPPATDLEPEGALSSAPTEFSAFIPAGNAVNARFKVSTIGPDGPWDLWEQPFSPCVTDAREVRTYDGLPLPVGQTLHFKVDVENASGDGAGSSVPTFYINPQPTADIVSPDDGGLTFIHNFDEVDEWDDTSPRAKPRIRISYAHPTGQAADTVEVRIDGTTVMQYQKVIESDTETDIDLSDAIARDTPFTIEVRAASGGTWSDWSALRNARLNWAQAVWHVPDVAGAGSLTAKHDPLEGGSDTRVAYLYKGETGTWSKRLSDVSSGTYGIDVLIRMTSADAAQSPSLSAWRIEYDTAGEATPDLWRAAGATLSLDAGFRRFGVHSLAIRPSAGVTERWVRNIIPVVVSDGTEYTASVYVHTLGRTLSEPVRLAIWDGNGELISVAPVDGDGSTDDSTGKGPEDWQRIFATMRVVGDEVYAGVVFGESEDFRVDSIQLEEGAIASQWAPGGLGPAVVLDVGGIAVDASAGGIFRLRTAAVGNPIIQLDRDRLITTRHRATGEDPRQLGTFWRGGWVESGDYRRDDMVLDGAWTMVANTDTNERAAPYPYGPLRWLQSDSPSWIEETGEIAQHVVGARYGPLDHDLFIVGARFHGDLQTPPDPNLRYSFYIIRDPEGDAVPLLVQAHVIAYENGWLELGAVGNILVRTGETVDFGMRITNIASYTDTSMPYEYIRTSTTIHKGEFMQVVPSTLVIHHLDGNDVEREDFLLGLQVGDVVRIDEMTWSVSGATNRVWDAIHVPVRPFVRPKDFGPKTITFRQFASASAKWVKVVDGYASDPLVKGFSGPDYETAIGTLTEDSYGVDIETQDATVSEDWDIVAYPGNGGVIAPQPSTPEPLLHTAKRYRTTDTDIPDMTETTVPMNAADIIGGVWGDLFAQENNGILVKRECYIRPSAAVHYHGTSEVGRRTWYLYHHHASGGADVVSGSSTVATNNQFWQAFTGPVLHVMPNDYFTIAAYHNADKPVTVVGDTGTWLQAELVKEVT